MKEELLKINESCDSNNGISSQRQTLVFFLTFEIFEHRKGLRRFPRFFKLLLEFFLVEYRFEAIYSNSIQFSRKQLIFGAEYIFDTRTMCCVPLVSFEIYTT